MVLKPVDSGRATTSRSRFSVVRTVRLGTHTLHCSPDSYSPTRLVWRVYSGGDVSQRRLVDGATAAQGLHPVPTRPVRPGTPEQHYPRPDTPPALGSPSATAQ